MRHALYVRLGSILAAIVLLVSLLATPLALAQPTAEPSAVTVDELESLVATLEDEKERS